MLNMQSFWVKLMPFLFFKLISRIRFYFDLHLLNKLFLALTFLVK